MRYSSSAYSFCVSASLRPARVTSREIGSIDEVADAHHRLVGANRRATQKRLHAGEELVVVERLCEVVIGARVEPRDLVRHGVARGEHENGRGKGAISELSCDKEAASFGRPMSRMTRSGRWSRAICSPLSPSSAVRTEYPLSDSVRSSTSSTSRRSSTTSTVAVGRSVVAMKKKITVRCSASKALFG